MMKICVFVGEKQANFPKRKKKEQEKTRVSIEKRRGGDENIVVFTLHHSCRQGSGLKMSGLSSKEKKTKETSLSEKANKLK